ncbi:NLP/P60 protein [Acetonema longum DSM 6540]|uniref:NLP/P60 protein n=2 Tax=Acetonema TaxID=2373 RepID=F7NJV0_9FIRM|nr:NLP/P60 protein [Acetonema longum DSM 6540]
MRIILAALTVIAGLFLTAGVMSDEPAASGRAPSQEKILFYWLFTGRDIRQQTKVFKDLRGKDGGQSEPGIVAMAKQYLGTPYIYGGSTPDGFDCSGYLMYLFGEFGRELPRTADEQATAGEPVAFERLQPGDMVFFITDEPFISHSGLYIGDHRFIHASSSARSVIISRIDDPYWQSAFRTGRRLSVR